MNEKEQKRFNDAKAYLEEQWNESGDSAWLEGWICGFTDPENPIDGVDNELIHDALFDFLREKRG